MKLLAKSRHGGRDTELFTHLREVYEAASTIFERDGAFTDAWLRFFGIRDAPIIESFHASVRAAALLHDLGKANEEFQAAVSGNGRTIQSIRHEHLSALIIALPEIRGWLQSNSRIDVDAVIAAVLSHHMKAAESGEWAFAQPRGRLQIELFLGAPDVRNALELIRSSLGLAPAPPLPTTPWDPRLAPWSNAYASVLEGSRAFRRTLRKNSARRALVCAVKAGLVAADTAGSALVRETSQPSTWISEVLSAPRLEAADILDAVIGPRVETIARKTSFQWHTFQRAAGALGSRALMLAACGSGKTLAAWKWAEAQARERSIHHVVFLYPTRGTATEGFRDYVGFAPEHEATLLHASARFELDAMAANPNEAMRGKSYRDEREERLRALGLWPRRYFSATVDQFLGFLEHSYESTCLLPVLARSAVVIDEVHSFDRSLFRNLIALLAHFDVPVLCMTATLPVGRRGELAGCGLRVYPSDLEREELGDLEEKERHPRYHLERAADDRAIEMQAGEAFLRGERVLCVTNTVARCQMLATTLEKRLNAAVLVYHSRFRLTDRQRAHRRTIDAFKQREVAAIAVTTQVCEMSLDLDADILFTELAPVPSLVQRFGRVNRHLAAGASFRGRLIVYLPPNPLPYTAEELRASEAFIADLCDQDVSQRELALALENHAPTDAAADGSARFLEGAYFATRGSLRDEDEYTTPCLLDADLPAAEALHARRESLDGFIIGLPRKFVREDAENRPAWLPRYLGIASSKLYDTECGFLGDIGR